MQIHRIFHHHSHFAGAQDVAPTVRTATVQEKSEEKQRLAQLLAEVGWGVNDVPQPRPNNSNILRLGLQAKARNAAAREALRLETQAAAHTQNSLARPSPLEQVKLDSWGIFEDPREGNVLPLFLPLSQAAPVFERDVTPATLDTMMQWLASLPDNGTQTTLTVHET